MNVAEIVSAALQLAVGAVATFFAILVWSRTRDIAWILIVLAVLVAYAGYVVRTLEQFGLIDASKYVIAGFPVFELVLSNLPGVLITAAFVVLLTRRRLR
jgi:hypothetical protein